MGQYPPETIALIFDFDDTLTPDSTSQFVQNHLEIPPDTFWSEWVDPLRNQGWDMLSSFLYTLIKHSSDSEEHKKITDTKLAKFGQQLTFYPGVPELFDNLRREMTKIDSSIKLEFYLIGCGLREIIRNTVIAPHFSDIWACEFAYKTNGEIFFPKNIVSFTDKTRYLFHISKGISRMEEYVDPFLVNKRIPRHQRPIPFEQMIYVADGFTDIPCFALIQERGGITVGVYDKDAVNKAVCRKELSQDERVTTLHPTDYRPHSELYQFLTLGLEAISKKISLKRNSQLLQRLN